jgi:hypothetical protein
MSTNEQQDVPQFQTAEFAGSQSTGDTCCICRQPIAGSFYRINRAKACAACSQRVQASTPRDTHATFSRAILYGLGGALLGLILYSAVGILLHLEIGYVALAVGFLVGKAMMMGSGNVGGRRYQWVAVALTYAAVSLSAVPIAIAQYSGTTTAHVRQVGGTGVQDRGITPPDAAQAPDAAQTDASSSDASSSPAPAAHKMAHTPANPGKALGMLLILGLASPLLEFAGSPVGGALGLIILLVGVRIAWRLTKAGPLPTVEGPY